MLLIRVTIAAAVVSGQTNSFLSQPIKVAVSGQTLGDYVMNVKRRKRKG